MCFPVQVLLVGRVPKQPIVMDSIMKAKYIAASEATKEVFCFKKYITELDVISLDSIYSTTTMTVP